MNKCICSTCANLKTVFDENDEEINGIEEVCEYGFPDETCVECELDGCDLTCTHYVSDEIEETFTMLKCSGCGKELKCSSKNDNDDVVFCVDCYLTKK